MEEWTYTFDPVPTTEWKKQIEADLKGTPISSLTSEWWAGEILDPLTRPEKDSEPICLPNHLFAHPPIVTERIVPEKNDTPAAINKMILDALSAGVERIVVACPVHTFHPAWLNGVFLEMAPVHIEPSHSLSNDLIVLPHTIPPDAILRICRRHNSAEITDVWTSARAVGRDFRLVYEIDDQGVWTDSMAELSKTIVTDLRRWIKSNLPPQDFFNCLDVQLNSSGDYVLQIIQARVIRLLIQNLLQSFSVDPGHVHSGVEVLIRQRPDEHPDLFLIRASMCSLAASMSGVTSVCISSRPSHVAHDMYRRVGRHVTHLLHFESNMYKGFDPIAGAYVPDHYTRKWTTQIWSQLDV